MKYLKLENKRHNSAMSDLNLSGRLSIRGIRPKHSNTSFMSMRKDREAKPKNDDQLINKLFMAIECERLTKLLREKTSDLDFANAKMVKMDSEIQRDKLMRKEYEQIRNRVDEYEIEIERLKRENDLLIAQSVTKSDNAGKEVFNNC